MERRLAAIMATDVVGYSRLIRADEEGTITALKALRANLIDPKIAEHHGRIVKLMGDGMLAEFASVVDAVRAAVETQAAVTEHNAGLPENKRIEFRVGINLGDVVIDGDDIQGDGVNVAARLEGLAEAGSICISGSVYDQVRDRLDLAFEDMGEQEVKNIARPVRAYRVLPEGVAGSEPEPATRRGMSATQMIVSAAVVVLVVAGLVLGFWQPWKPDVAPASLEQMVFPLPKKPSVAVLPFDNLTGDPDQDYVADGMTETIISTLSRIPDLFVIARNSSFTYKGKAVKVQQVAEELGVRYVLEGSVQRAGEEVRITVQLIDALKGHHLWSETYDRQSEDLFDLQDDIALNTTIALQVKLTTGEEARMLSRTTSNVRAWTLYQQALSNFFKFSAEGNRAARKSAEMALAEDLEFADAIIIVGFTHLVDARSGYSQAPKDSLNLAIEYAEKARSLADDAPNLYNLMQSIYRYQREFDKAVVAGEKAIELSPNSAISLLATAMTTNLAGQFDRSIELAQMAIRQSPHHRSTGLIWLSRSLWFEREYSKAIDAATEGLDRAESPIIAATHLLNLAIAFVETGEMDRARQAVSGALQKVPQLNLSFLKSGFGYKKESDWQRFASALRSAGLPERSPLALPDKPSIAVLPFTNMSGDPEQEYFADGMSEDLITDLSKISGLFVIARNSSFAYKGKTVDVKQVSRELGVRYVLEGSVRRAGDQVRINAQLIDATTGGHLWADRYDGSMSDVFALQDKVAGSIVTALALNLTAGENAKPKGTDNAAAYDAFLKGWEHYRLDTPEQYAKALRFFGEATELDPGYDRAWAAMASIYWKAYRQDWAAVLATGSTEARSKAFKLIAKASEKPTLLAYQVASQMAVWRGKFDEAIEAAEQALALDPNDADSQVVLAEALIYGGEPERAQVLIESARRHDPHSEARYAYFQGLAEFGRDQFEAAATSFRRTLELNPVLWNPEGRLGNTYCQPCVVLIAAYGHLGKIDDAQVLIEKIKKEWAGFSIASEYFLWPYKTDTDMKRFTDGLLKAGVEE